MTKVKVKLRVKTSGHKVWDEIEVEKADAEYLVQNGNAVPVSEAASSIRPRELSD